jgi:hypothetical protein
MAGEVELSWGRRKLLRRMGQLVGASDFVCRSVRRADARALVPVQLAIIDRQARAPSPTPILCSVSFCPFKVRKQHTAQRSTQQRSTSRHNCSVQDLSRMSINDTTCCQKLQHTIARTAFAELRELNEHVCLENAAKRLMRKMPSRHSLVLPKTPLTPPKTAPLDTCHSPAESEEEQGVARPATESLLRRLQVP